MTDSLNIMKWYLTIIIAVTYGIGGQSQSLTESNLPIVIINSEGFFIPDEPKVAGTMTIYYQADAATNTTSDTAHYSGAIGIERRGQTSLSLFPKNGFGIETRTDEGENNNVKLFGWPRENDWVIHSPYSDKSLIRNKLTYSLAAGVMEYAPRTQLCELILNGDYYGVVLFTEKIKRDDDRVNVCKLNPNTTEGDSLTGGYILRFDKGSDEDIAWVSPHSPLEGAWQETRFLYHYPKNEAYNSQQSFYIRKYVTDFESALLSADFTDSTDGYHQYIDAQSFIDYMLINELGRNVDGYRLSTYMYKDKLAPLKLGPVWDFNLAWGNVDYCDGSNIEGWAYDFNEVCPDDFWLVHFWWSRLLEDDAFADALADRWKSLRTTTLSDDRMLHMIDSLTEVLAEPQVRNDERWATIGNYIWPNNFVGETYSEEIDYLKNWMLQRAAWIDDNIGVGTTTAMAGGGRLATMIYPNPTTGIVHVRGCTGDCELVLYRVDGSRIASYKLAGGYTELEVDHGLYIYTVKDGSGAICNRGRLMVR